MYLILTPSPYSENDMLNYKCLDSYQNFVKGWVRQILALEVGNKRIIIGKVKASLFKNISIYLTILVQVNHSQKLNEKPLTPWFVSLVDGKILSAHCDCMAGLG